MKSLLNAFISSLIMGLEIWIDSTHAISKMARNVISQELRAEMVKWPYKVQSFSISKTCSQVSSTLCHINFSIFKRPKFDHYFINTTSISNRISNIEMWWLVFHTGEYSCAVSWKLKNIFSELFHLMGSEKSSLQRFFPTIIWY